MWDIQTMFPITQQPTIFKHNKINYIVRKKQTKHDVASYYHAKLLLPSISTLMSAIKKGNLITRSGIEQLAFDKLLPTTIATWLGHLNQEHKNLRSTKILSKNNNDPSPIKSTKTNNIFTQYFHLSQETHDCRKMRRIHSNQTGRFLYVSLRGYQYIMIMYDYDSNAIMIEVLKTHQGKELATPFYTLCTKLKIDTNDENIFVLDNEYSTHVKDTIHGFNAKYQLAPPH